MQLTWYEAMNPLATFSAWIGSLLVTGFFCLLLISAIRWLWAELVSPFRTRSASNDYLRLSRGKFALRSLQLLGGIAFLVCLIWWLTQERTVIALWDIHPGGVRHPPMFGWAIEVLDLTMGLLLAVVCIAWALQLQRYIKYRQRMRGKR